MCLLEGGTTNKNKTPLFILSIIYYNYNFKVHPYSVKIRLCIDQSTTPKARINNPNYTGSRYVRVPTPLLLVDRLVS